MVSAISHESIRTSTSTPCSWSCRRNGRFAAATRSGADPDDAGHGRVIARRHYRVAPGERLQCGGEFSRIEAQVGRRTQHAQDVARPRRQGRDRVRQARDRNSRVGHDAAAAARMPLRRRRGPAPSPPRAARWRDCRRPAPVHRAARPACGRRRSPDCVHLRHVREAVADLPVEIGEQNVASIVEPRGQRLDQIGGAMIAAAIERRKIVPARARRRTPRAAQQRRAATAHERARAGPAAGAASSASIRCDGR